MVAISVLNANPSLIALFFAANSSRLNSCSIGGYVIIFSFTHASVDSWTGLCNGAFEAHHHPLAWKTWSTCMEAVWEAGACRKISLRSLLSSLLACCHELSCSMCSRARSRSVG